MNRLTKEDTNKVCYDCWELCELDDVCKRDCFKPTPCKIPSMISKLAKYEDTGFEPNELQKVIKKQIPKKPEIIEGKMWVCPTCNNNLLWLYEKYPEKKTELNKGLPFCLSCGQALNWVLKERKSNE